jgi:transketolase
MSATEDLKHVAAELRHRLVRMSAAAKTPHLGSGLSCIDILVAAYWNVLRIDPAKADDPDRDRLILSKGHAATALYAVLARRGFFSADLLDSFGHPGAPLAEQPAPGCAPGVELATGSLGHGLPVGVGMALAARLQRRPHRVVVVMSDGECNEGTVWEAAMFAAARGLGNLAVVVDYNKWQATGRSNEIMQLPSFVDKWSAFGWHASEVDGHDIDAVTAGLQATVAERPTAIVAHTVKGKGISFMEDDNNWHYRIPTPAEVELAAEELGLK